MSTTQTTLVNTSVKNGVMTLELTFDPGNCYTHEMMRQLDEAILKARFDEAVQVIVIRGSGEKFFCAGADINMLKSADPTFKYYFCLHANETLNRLEHTPKLVIAALNGHTVGGGLEALREQMVQLRSERDAARAALAACACAGGAAGGA